jgi:hypothetical protein
MTSRSKEELANSVTHGIALADVDFEYQEFPSCLSDRRPAHSGLLP